MLTTTRNTMLACALSGLAGYVDGVGFIHLGGLFVSFMSGNSTRLGVSLAESHWWDAGAAAGLIALFVVGAAFGSLIALGTSRHRQATILLVEALLLASAASAAAFGWDHTAVAAIVMAMGLENAVSQIGGPGLGLTYMTGALVKVGQLVAVALRGGPAFAWLPNFGLWGALVVGAAIGTLGYQRFALSAIWFAALLALVLAAMLAVTNTRAEKV